MKMKIDMMINLSGGIDSTYCAYHWLKNNPKKKALIHHALINKRRGREYINQFEHRATLNVINWLRNEGLTNFEYVETKTDVSVANTRLNTMHLLAFNTIALLNQSKYECKDLILPAGLDDVTMPIYPRLAAPRNKLYSIYLPDVKLHYPIKHLSRKELIAGMPKELVKLCYWCQMDDNVNGVACGKCWTCSKTNKYINE